MWLLRPLPLLSAAVTLCLAVAGGVTLVGGVAPLTRPATAPATGAAPDAAALRAVDVLESWDRSRAAAYSSGDVAALRRLYVRGAAAGREDIRVLREYVERGLAVRDLELQRSAVEVLDSTEQRLRVEVVERLGGATVEAAGTEVALPRDRPERRVVTLVRDERRWQVASVVRVAATSGGRLGSGR
jgi:hypothetical protein